MSGPKAKGVSTVLVADDDPFNRATVEAVLKEEGHRLVFASDGPTACAMAKELRPDLLLLDVMMPGLDGFGVCRELRRDPSTAQMPVIMITALEDRRSRLEGLRSGADDFLSKPLRADELCARVRTVVSLNRYRALAEQKARFEGVFAHAPVGIALVDAGGVLLEANARARAWLPGLAPDTSAGRLAWEGIEPGAAGPIRDLFGAALRSGGTEPCRLTVAGPERPLVLSLRGVALAESGVREVLLVFADITAEVEAQQALEALNRDLDGLVRSRTRQLEEANELLVSYAGFVSHDLRSPLSVMKGYLSLLKDSGVPLTPESAPMIEQAYRASLVMEELIRNILQLARDEAGTPGARERTDPEPVVQRVKGNFLAHMPRPEPEIVVHELPLVGVSPLMVERVFFNLVGNALKYSAHREAPRVEIGRAPDDEGCPVIYVRDNGVGFDERDADRLFREFSRLGTSEGREGLGLGLSLVNRLVRAHGGRIWAEGRAGQGATFFVRLPSPPQEGG